MRALKLTVVVLTILLVALCVESCRSKLRTDRHGQVFGEGLKAGDSGAPLESCPYEGVDAISWRKGWKSAR